MMLVLDCQTTDSIYMSLEAIAGANRGAIEAFLKDMDLNSYYGGGSPPPCPGNEFLLDAFRCAFGTDLSYDKTCWFHLTRTDNASTFEDGILPLGQRLDSLFDWLYGLFDSAVTQQQWNDFRQEISQRGSLIYKMKTESPFHWGPYAILVRDLAFKPVEVGNHDYFSGPEIIEDICDCFEKQYQVSLLKIFLQKTKPCIVKFIDYGTRSNYVRAALWHLHKIVWQETCTDYCNDCFDGKGVPVSREQILSVEFPQYVASTNP
jgi:hypothetical protein